MKEVLGPSVILTAQPCPIFPLPGFISAEAPPMTKFSDSKVRAISPKSWLCPQKIGGERMPLAAIGIDFNRILLSA
jgi:hypothetical protein